jgi:hypothetical protein
MNRNKTFSTKLEVTVSLGEGYRKPRQSVRRICQGFSGELLARLDERSAYPIEFVKGTRRTSCSPMWRSTFLAFPDLIEE